MKQKRLVDARARWLSENGTRVGLTFECPLDENHRIGVFWIRPMSDQSNSLAVWDRQGDTLDDLTISPSVNALAQKNLMVHESFDLDSLGMIADCRFHGFIRQGELSW